MAKTAGRTCVIKKATTALAGLVENSLTVNGSPINVESKSDNGFETHLANVLVGRSLTISGNGYCEDQVLRDLSLSTTASSVFLTDLTYEFANGDEISGDFTITAYEEGSPMEDGNTFSATFTSNGAWTYTAA